MISTYYRGSCSCVNFHRQINIVDTNRNLNLWILWIRKSEEGVILWFSALSLLTSLKAELDCELF